MDANVRKSNLTLRIPNYSLKGLLVFHGRDISRSHDLVKLLNDISGMAPELLDYSEALETISEYGVGVRYPDFYYEPSLEEASQAYDIAKRVVNFVEISLSH